MAQGAVRVQELCCIVPVGCAGAVLYFGLCYVWLCCTVLCLAVLYCAMIDCAEPLLICFCIGSLSRIWGGKSLCSECLCFALLV